MLVGRDLSIENALVLLESLLYKFGQISATGNALMHLESILCKLRRISATGNALVHTNHGQKLHF